MADYWVKSGTGGNDSGSSWANAAESIPGLMAAQAIAGGDNIYVHCTHAFNAGGAITWTLPESGTGVVKVICVDGGDATGASLTDGVVGTETTGAVEETGGDFAFAITTVTSANAALIVRGMTIRSGTTGAQASADITVQGANNGLVVFDNCRLEQLSGSTNAPTGIGNNANTSITFRRCVFKFGVAGQNFIINGGQILFNGCSLDTSVASPTTLFTTGARPANVTCVGCDWSGATNVVNRAASCSGPFRLSSCVIGTPATGTSAGWAQPRIEMQACAAVDGTNGADILSYYYEDFCGDVQDSQTVYLTTGGATGEQDDGTDTPYSWVMTPSAAASAATPLYTPWVYALVGTTGDKTVTIKVAHTEAAVLKENEVWAEVLYMGEPGLAGTQRVANSPHAVVEMDDAAHLATASLALNSVVTGDNRTDDAVDGWTGLTGEVEHTLTASINVAEVGYLAVRVALAKDTTNPVYVDPKIGIA